MNFLFPGLPFFVVISRQVASSAEVDRNQVPKVGIPAAFEEDEDELGKDWTPRFGIFLSKIVLFGETQSRF